MKASTINLSPLSTAGFRESATFRVIKLLSLMLVLSLLSTQAKAQFIPSVGLHGYLTESVDFSKVPDRDIELEGRSGWHAGFDVRLSKKVLYLQPGLHYYSTTTRVTDLKEIGIPQRQEDQRHTSLKAPVLAGLRLGLNKTAALHLQGGPVTTFSLKEDLTNDLGGMRNVTFGMAAAAGIDLLHFNVNLRYEWGLTQAFVNQPGNADVVSLGVGLVF